MQAHLTWLQVRLLFLLSVAQHLAKSLPEGTQVREEEAAIAQCATYGSWELGTRSMTGWQAPVVVFLRLTPTLPLV